ncbi:pirin family protein [Shinella sp. CPCC 100929]|uniref:Pirin family protein n=1 Tax=Shinella lacus TaxID=2654216 RepID=A0ABT1RBJ7_9HYPH|nr:pirin family protein [Shinella lacus]MCQ4632574.1 pirin family protein [Shinella lacus]
MSWMPGIEPQCPEAGTVDDIEMLIVPRARDLGGFEVRRALPAPERQMVGPFIFFDQMGPAEFLHDGGIDVRPHPHIGLATVTYLYQGEFQHRDSLGTNQMIYPGEVNWMVAGNGVTHSERTSPETRAKRHSLFGIQTWVALPEADEDKPASFEHQGADALPFLTGEGKEVRLILGNAWGERAPVKTFSEMFYADAVLEAGAKLPLPDNHEDRGLYVTQGSVLIAGQEFLAGRMMVFRPGDPITVTAGEAGARLMLLGGETMNGPRYIAWNFVASSKEKLEAAREAWSKGDFEHGRFRLPPDDKAEFIPFPETLPTGH